MNRQRYGWNRGLAPKSTDAQPRGARARGDYACIAGNVGLRNHLTLRDHLRSDRMSARAYGELKKQLAARFPDDIDGYVDGKTDLILAILARRADFSPKQLAEIAAANRIGRKAE